MNGFRVVKPVIAFKKIIKCLTESKKNLRAIQQWSSIKVEIDLLKKFQYFCRKTHQLLMKIAQKQSISANNHKQFWQNKLWPNFWWSHCFRAHSLLYWGTLDSLWCDQLPYKYMENKKINICVSSKRKLVQVCVTRYA